MITSVKVGDYICATSAILGAGRTGKFKVQLCGNCGENKVAIFQQDKTSWDAFIIVSLSSPLTNLLPWIPQMCLTVWVCMSTGQLLSG